MALTGAMLTAFTGIESNQFAVETIGNNVANVNTTAYKSSRAHFESLLYRTLEEGTAPDAEQGGTNPLQVGHGSGVAATQRSFVQGGTERTGVLSDLAIDGEGFFILDGPEGDRAYTRDGAFSLNEEYTLVAANGSFVQGYAASEDGTIDTGSLTNLLIPLGGLSSAAATTEAILTGNLDAAGDLAASGSQAVSNAMTTISGTPATAATALTSLVDQTDVALFNNGDVIAIRGVQKGGIDIPDGRFIVGTDGSTYGELADFLESLFAIDTSASAAGTPGVTISDGALAPAGALLISANVGDVNAISIDAASIRNDTTGTAPFEFTTTPATGEGATTSFLVFDSLGTPIDVRLRFALEQRTSGGNQWRFTAESPDANGVPELVGQGTVSFDLNGRLVNATGTRLNIPHDNTGAVSPLSLNLDFSDLTGLTASDGESSVTLKTQDGFAEGTLSGYKIDDEGIISGTFSNGQESVLGQVALATFANNLGLVARSQNEFVVGVNSGPPMIQAPRTNSAGRINSAELELSNVDLPRELIGLITASTGFSAASRAVRTADDMLQELMLLVR